MCISCVSNLSCFKKKKKEKTVLRNWTKKDQSFSWVTAARSYVPRICMGHKESKLRPWPELYDHQLHVWAILWATIFGTLQFQIKPIQRMDFATIISWRKSQPYSLLSLSKDCHHNLTQIPQNRWFIIGHVTGRTLNFKVCIIQLN